MSSRKFRFVSPGVFLKEIDNSQLPSVRESMGPVIIGKTTKGPALKPHKIRSLEELETVFGKTTPGVSLDPWREGSTVLSDSYALHAAKAYLTAGRGTDSPVTMIRLLGIAGDDATPDTAGEPGWQAKSAYGLFLTDKPTSATVAGNTLNLDLAAIFYGESDDFGVKLSGPDEHTENATDGVEGNPVRIGTDMRINLVLSGSTGNVNKKPLFKDIRKDLNTNPTATNDKISAVVSGTLSEKYWLGESFGQQYDKFDATITGTRNAVIVKLQSGANGMSDFRSGQHAANAAKSGWVVGQDTTNDNANFDIDNQQKLFRVVALNEGLQSSKELIISIEDIKLPRADSLEVFGSFSLVVRKITNSGVSDVERFEKCNLDPSSQDFIARKVGDQYLVWSARERRNKIYGEFPNNSQFIRIEMNQDVVNQGGPINKEHVPFGFYGPVRPASVLGEVRKSGATAASGKLVVKASAISDGAVAAGLNGNTFKLKTIAVAAGLDFTFDSTQTPAAAAAKNAEGQADENNPKIGTSGVTTVQSLASAIKQAIEGSKLASDITVGAATDEEDGTFSLTITQKTRGALADTLASASAHLTISNPAGGANGSADTEHVPASPSAWVSGAVNLHNLAAQGAIASFNWPKMPLINTASADRGYFVGVSPYKMTFDAGGSAQDGSTINPGYVDFLRRMPAHDSNQYVTDQDSGIASSGKTRYDFKFSLDDVVLIPRPSITTGSIVSRSDVTEVLYVAGSKKDSGRLKSYSAQVASSEAGTELRTLLEVVDGFHMPLDGGHDGLDVTESDPFNERVLEGSSTSTSYAFASIDRALELMKDPEAIEHNLAVMPGISNTSLTTKLVNFCEARADSLAIIDLPDVYCPPSQERKNTFQDRLPLNGPETSAKALVQRQMNSSYGATYYPWVKIKDVDRNRDVWVPPSVVALGVMANTERSSEVWFAPAGFNRGGLDQGNAGVPVLQATEQLLSRDRDTLYAANINPIASFVSEGIVIFGQKTLQSTQSALDRINVRRLLIFVKKEVSRISNNLLFEQNIQATWTRFHGQVTPFLESVKVRFGLTDFKVVLDTTTTTADLVDRNIMYAKIFLKPARSIEFIAVDFVITRTGASFADPLE